MDPVCNGLQAAGAHALVSRGRRVLPSMGLAWSHAVNTRLFLARHDAGHVDNPQEAAGLMYNAALPCVRSMQVSSDAYEQCELCTHASALLMCTSLLSSRE